MKLLILTLLFTLTCFGQPFEGVPVPDNGSELRRYIYAATPVSIYDADTITVDLDLGFNLELKSEKVRLYGINAPEIKGTERPLGLAARTFLVELLAKPRKNLYILTLRDKKEKFGRWLGIVLLEAEDGKLTNVNKAIVDAGHAVIERY